MIAEFTVYLEEEVHRSPNTVEGYGIDLRQLKEWFGKDLLTATRSDAKAYLRHLSAKSLAITSILRKIAACNSFYSWQVREERMTTNPFGDLDKPEKPGRLPKFLSDAEMETLMSYPADGPWDIRDRALISLLDATGMRVGELEGIDIDDVDFETNRIRVIGKGNKERIVPFGYSCAENLRTYLAVRDRLAHNGEPALFVSNKGYRLQVCGVQWIVRHLGWRILNKDITPHIFRHTCATSMINGGADYGTVADILGHADVNTTRRTYAHTAIERTEEEYRRTHPRARQASGRGGLRLVS